MSSVLGSPEPDMGIIEFSKGCEIMKGLEHLMYKVRQGELALLSLDKRKLRGILSMCKNT